MEKKKPARKSTKKVTVRKRDREDKTLYVYVSPTNRHHALSKPIRGKFGSASKFINHLIAKHRGLKGTKTAGPKRVAARAAE